MKIVFTKHVKDKLLENEAISLAITKDKIIGVLKNPTIVDKKPNPHHSIGKLNNTLSLCVIWKAEDDIINAITFYPAEKGRYESKILRGR